MISSSFDSFQVALSSLFHYPNILIYIIRIRQHFGEMSASLHICKNKFRLFDRWNDIEDEMKGYDFPGHQANPQRAS
jgi:hypothetical protein